MPGWHAKTKRLVADGKLIVLGIAPEQHGDRMALFLQWKEMQDMTVMLDAYNQYDLRAVPITVLLDESGVIRSRNPKEADLEKFLAAPPAIVGDAPKAPRLGAFVDTPSLYSNDPAALSDLASAYDRTVQEHAYAIDEEVQFERGVAHRKAFDAGGGKDLAQFRSAIQAWRASLKLDPNNYIHRRRLQQYGPRLDKPYPFYDWVETARREIAARGQKPVPLLAEPGGAELAKPLREKDQGQAVEKPQHPDPDNLLFRDVLGVVRFDSVVVPHTKSSKDGLRIYATLTPSPELKAKWNDEAGRSTLHIAAPDGWEASDSVLTVLPPARGQDSATTARRLEFDLRRKSGEGGGKLQKLKLQLFYHVCFGEEQLCEYMRKDVELDLQIRTPPPRDEDPLHRELRRRHQEELERIRPRGW